MDHTVGLTDIAADGVIEQTLREVAFYRHLGVPEGHSPAVEFGTNSHGVTVRFSGNSRTEEITGHLIGHVAGNTLTLTKQPPVPESLDLDDAARTAFQEPTAITPELTGALRTLFGNAMLLVAARTANDGDVIMVPLPPAPELPAQTAYELAAPHLGKLDTRRALRGYAAFHSLGIKDIPGGVAFADGSTVLVEPHEHNSEPAIPPIALTVSIETPVTASLPQEDSATPAVEQLISDNHFDAALGQVLLHRLWPHAQIQLDLARGQAHITTPAGTTIAGALPIATIAGDTTWLWAWEDADLPPAAREAAEPIRAAGVATPTTEKEMLDYVTVAKAVLGRPASVRVAVAPGVDAIALLSHPQLQPHPLDAATLWDTIANSHPSTGDVLRSMSTFLSRHGQPFTQDSDGLRLSLSGHELRLVALPEGRITMNEVS